MYHIFSRIQFSAETPTIDPPPPPPGQPSAPSFEAPSPVDIPPIHVTIEDTRPPIDFPPELFKHPSDPSTLVTLLSGVGVGAVVAAIISGVILWIVELKKQAGENSRKLIELTRQDQREWNDEIRQAYVDSRAALGRLRDAVMMTRLHRQLLGSKNPLADHQAEINKLFGKILKVRQELRATADVLGPVVDDELFKTHEAAVAAATHFLDKFERSGETMKYPPEDFITESDPNFGEVEANLLAATKQALKTPDAMPQPKKDQKRRKCSRGSSTEAA